MEDGQRHEIDRPTHAVQADFEMTKCTFVSPKFSVGTPWEEPRYQEQVQCEAIGSVYVCSFVGSCEKQKILLRCGIEVRVHNEKNKKN